MAEANDKDNEKIMIKDIPYTPEENIEFDQNGEWVLFEISEQVSKFNLRALSLPFIFLNITSVYWIVTNFILGNHIRNAIWLSVILIPSSIQLVKQYKFQNSILSKMVLIDNGDEVVLHPIFGNPIKIKISDIMKGEYYIHGNCEYYRFTLAGNSSSEYYIDYPETMKYP